MPTESRWTIDIPKVTVPTFIFGSPTEQLPDVPAFIDADRPDKYFLTLDSWRLWCKRFAAGLQAAGLQRGDPVLLYSGNTLFFPTVVLGVLMAGGIFTGANPGYTDKEVAYQLDNTGAKFFICGEENLSMGLKVAEKALFPKDKMFVFDGGYDTFDGKGKDIEGVKHWSKLIASKEQGEKFKWEDGEHLVDDTVVLNFSSGTTGLPKGVQITHMNNVSNSSQYMALHDLQPEHRKKDPRWLCFLPMYHAMAQTIFVFNAPKKRIPVYIMQKYEFTKMLKAVQDFRITELQLVPPIVVAMTKRPETKQYDLSSVVRATSGAAPLGREVTEKFDKLWPEGQVNMKQGYGMTEVTCSALGWDPRKTCEDFSVGEPNANNIVMLTDPETGKEAQHGERGEIWIKGPNVMKGYWRNEKATKDTFSKDGWLKTGDIAYQDKDGHFFVVDRMKELIKVKGMQVAPAELEAQLLEHPKVSDACVVGVTINGEELPRAYIVQSEDVEPDEVAKWMENKVARHKRLVGGVKKVEAIQKNPSGKILRRMYREQAQKEVQPQAKL